MQALKSHGFVWWSVGYPDTPQPAWYLEARNNGILPLAYVNLTQNHYQLGTGYTGSCWQVANYTDLCNVDLAEPSWKTWILSRVDFAYSRGARGIKWDSAKVNTKLYPGILSTAYANMVAILQAVRSAHPDLVFMFNDGIELSKYLGANVASLVDGLQDEQRVAYLSDPAAGMRQWAQEEINDLQYFNTTYGIPVAEIEYFPADQLNSIAAWDAFNKVKSYGFAPYIVNTEFTTAGIGLSSGGPYWWP